MSFTGIMSTKLGGEEAREKKPDSLVLEHKCELAGVAMLVICRKYFMIVSQQKGDLTCKQEGTGGLPSSLLFSKN